MELISATILVVDDDAAIRKLIRDRLASLGYQVLLAESGQETLAMLEREEPDLALVDIELPDVNGLDLLSEIRKRNEKLTVVMITAYGSIDRAVSAMKEGAYDFIPKPFKPEHITLVVKKALERQQLTREVEALSEEVGKRYRLIVGSSARMNQAIDEAKKAAASRSTVLLLGESGTGKELFAHAIHNWSDRRARPFIAINCVGLSRELLESELFGHEKGAFTGAHELKKGKMELAHGGTVFLDEVGDVSLELQTKLLRFLQEREFERVGGTRNISVDVRVIAATNQDLTRLMREQRFRHDLYHRLNVISISLPPLRERKEDIAVLAQYYLERFSIEINKPFTDIAPEAERVLCAYGWPGNVRELANVIERGVVLGTGPVLNLANLPVTLLDGPVTSTDGIPSYRESMDLAKREMLRKVLAHTQGNQTIAAKLLGIQRTYLSRLIKELGIE